MGIELLSSRAVTGQFFLRLEDARKSSWISRVAYESKSDQAIEEYPFLTAAPVMREWIGGRLSKGFEERSIRIPNKHYEATIEFSEADMRRDKSTQIFTRIAELADKAVAHPRSLISNLLNNGESALCYDGHCFFDTDHAEGDSGVQSNIVDIDISATPGFFHCNPASPSSWELAYAVSSAVMRMLSIRDDKGEPLHAAAKRFLVMVPNSYLGAVRGIADSMKEKEVREVEMNPLRNLPFEFEWIVNPRLLEPEQFIVLRTDAPTRALIFQTETDVSLKVRAEGSDYTFNTAMCQFGVDAWHAAAFGYWQHASLVKLF